jgi:hypothetical protein
MNKVMITIRGGVLQSVTSTEHVQYLLVDHDNIEAGDSVSFEDFQTEDFLRTEDEMRLYIDGANREFNKDFLEVD